MVKIGSGYWKCPERFASIRLAGAVRVFDGDRFHLVEKTPRGYLAASVKWSLGGD